MGMIIDGKQMAVDIRREVAVRVARLTERGVIPCLAVILVGDDPASVSYVAGKRQALMAAGMADRSIRLPADTTEAELLAHIATLNADTAVHGILVQLPLPAHIDEGNILVAIRPDKDVDGFHPVNIGKLVIGQRAPIPCTPQGVVTMLKRTGIQTDGARAVVVGRSNIVGKPLALLLSRKEYNATVTLCHTGTRHLSEITAAADIVIAAVGRPGVITRAMVKPGAAVIDVGVNRIPDATKKSGYRLVGDVDFDAVQAVAAYITPVPGGVGPMTIAMLMQNTVAAAEQVAACPT
ncbi:MAG: bifunctional methylenetetrahydrofolate dehydrogenase/methenyltetrahydrofolate cyclohydrolase FolD [Treponema sp.]|nr:bifunctional methylenetetrahydrofolate dehydrogenase/methenyltetrahydrofolate cyclohydrolase FolD [Treponema sp.]